MKYKNMIVLNLILFILSFILKESFYFIFLASIFINIVIYIFVRTQGKEVKWEDDENFSIILNLFSIKTIKLFTFFMNLWWAAFSYKICKGNILYFALCFILFDVLFIAFNKIDSFLSAKYILKQDLVKSFKKAVKPKDAASNYAIFDGADSIISKQEKILKEKQESEEKTLTSLHEKYMSDFSEISKKLKEYPYDSNPVPDEMYEAVLDKFNFLEQQIKLQDKLIDSINVSRLSLYTNELILFLDSCIKIDLDNNDTYKEKMENILQTYEHYLDSLLQMIESQLKMEIDVNYKVLSNLLEREK